jgi:hypothetical protein
MIKYFEFRETISGITYFLRNVLATFFAYVGGYMIGWGIGIDDSLYTVMGIVVLGPTLWFNMCTIFKRSNALFPENANLITIGMLLGQVVAQALPIINIALIFMGCTLLFKNSDIENHKG